MPTPRRTRVLIVDDSAVMRSLLRSVVSADPGLDVAGTAADGAAGLESIGVLHPDLVLLDVEMPVMDGLETLRELRRCGHKMPVIVCSALTQRGAKITVDALASGASDYVAKPTGQANREAAVRALGLDLLPKIHALTHRNVYEQLPARRPDPAPAPPYIGSQSALAPPRRLELNRARTPSAQSRVLAIGLSTGGPAALDILLPTLPADFSLPVLVVQHMPELFTRLLAERLNGRCKLQVREAAQGDLVRPGVISIARGNWHLEALEAARAGGSPTMRMNQGPLENHCRPAVDVLFRSLVRVYGADVLAVVLTGMGSDGLLGCRAIREHGGLVLAQDEATSTVWGMPGAVANASLANRVLPLREIGPEILRLVGRTQPEVQLLRESEV